MRRFAWTMVFAVAVVVFWVRSLPAAFAQTAPNTVTVTQNAASVGRYDIYELTMENAAQYDNPWEDPSITAEFTSPTGSTYTVGGFLYELKEKDKTNVWKVRFAPPVVGAWSWTLSFANTMDKNPPFVTSGKFTCGASANRGFLRIHPCNNGRFMTEGDGQAFYPLGSSYSEEGFGDPPPADYRDCRLNEYWCTDNSWQPTRIDDFFLQAKDGGQNMMRFGSPYSSGAFNKKMFNLNGTGKNNYRLYSGHYLDYRMRAAHQVDWKLMMSPWEGNGASLQDFPKTYNLLDKVPADPVVTRAWLNSMQYIINRYGAYVDIWELGSRLKDVPPAYLDTVISYFRAHDPYHHLITVSFYPAGRTDLDVISTYQLAKQALSRPNSTTGLAAPVLVVERRYHGYAGIAYSFINHRLGEWTAFFNRGACLDVETAACAGWEKRATEKIFTDQIADFDPVAKPAALTLTPADQLSGSALSSQQDLGLYILHVTSKNAWVKGATVEVDVPVNNMKGQWLDPETGVYLDKPLTLQAGKQKISIPAFKNDIALRLRAGWPEQVIQFDNSTYRVNSDQSGITLTVTRQGDTSAAASVSYTTRDGLGKAGKDYTATVGTLSWAAGDAASKTITVPLIPTGLLRPDLDFLVDLSKPSAGAGLGLSRSALVAIVNTVVNTVEPLKPIYVVTNGAGKIDFTLKRIGKGVGPLTIPYSTGGQSARAGKDFVNIAPNDVNKVVWADGDMSPKTFSVTILSNSAATGDREVELNLGDYFFGCDLPLVYHGLFHRVPLVAGSTPPKWYHSMVIIQQDPKLSPGVLRFTGSTGDCAANCAFSFTPIYKVAATNSVARIPVSRLYGSHGEVSVKYATVGSGTAAEKLNYVPVKGSLTWADGDSADKFIEVPLVNTPGETGEVTVWLEMGVPTGGAHTGSVMGVGRGGTTSNFALLTIVYPESR